ncbi:hypothetical protein FACS1894133_4800 [Clostridia bacterium]|nr:hypothetical protein FACS1894133_4800 [Clostridia bacterium]
MNYLTILNKYSRYGEPVTDLSRFTDLCGRLGDPQREFKTVHVAGTNGKGSVCEYITRSLMREHRNIGKFASPYVREFNERIQYNGCNITDGLLDATVKLVAAAAPPKRGYSQFEILTAAAFFIFARCKVDYAVIEAGIGGRFDCTNVITPQVAVITSISLDHTEILGSTITEIAGHKAGIIKPGVPVVIGELPPEAAAVVREVAAQVSREAVANTAVADSPRYRNGASDNTVNGAGGGSKRGTRGGADTVRVISAEREKLNLRTCSVFGNNFDYRGVHIVTKLAGGHQVTNALTAFEACKCLNLKTASIKAGFAEAALPGRCEVAANEPLVIVDGAHNEEGLNALRDLIVPLPVYKTYIVGMAKGKDPLALVPLLLHQNMAVVTDGFDNAMPCESLVNVCRRAGIPPENIFTTSDLRSALTLAVTAIGNFRTRDAYTSLMAGAGGGVFDTVTDYPYINTMRYRTARFRDMIVVVAGSLYLAGAMLHILDEIFAECADDIDGGGDDDDDIAAETLRLFRAIMGTDEFM